MDLRGLTLLWIAVIFLVAAPAPLLAQGGGEDTQPKYITLKNVSVTHDKKTKKPTVKVTGKVDNLPSGTKVEFRLSWMSQVIDTHVESISGSTFNLEFKVKNAPLSSEDFELITVIDLDEQPGKVKGKIKKDPKAFPPALNPWTEYHREHRFKIADPATIRAETQFIRGFFEDRLKALSAIRKEVLANAKKVEEKTEFVKDDEFDPKAWRKWFDSKAVKPTREIQKELEEAWTSKRFQPYRRSLFSMRELAACVAYTILAESTKLYKAAGIDLDQNDTDPEEHKLNTNTRTRSPSDLRELKRLGQAVRAGLPKDEPSKKKEEPSGKSKGKE